MALHTPASSGQHRCPMCGPIAGPCPYEYEQMHEESQGTAHAVWHDPFLTQSPTASREEKRFFPWRAPRNNQTPDPNVFSLSVQPSMFLIILPGRGSGEQSGHGGQATSTAHPGTNSTSRKIFGPSFCKMLAHTSPCKLPGACCGEASFSTARYRTPVRVLVLNTFVHPRTPAACKLHEFLCPSAPHEFTCTDELSCMTAPCIDPHEFMEACMSRVCVVTKRATESDTCATR